MPRAGGYHDQPLELLSLLEAIDLIAATVQAKNQSGFDWSKFTGTQLELIRWLENDT